MADQNPRDRALLDPSSPLGDDLKTQSAVLSLLLIEHPVQLTVSELTRELAIDPDDFAQRDAVKRAVRDLTCVGLLHQQGVFVLPSRAAHYCSQLEVAI
jgi:hypothetical protein